MSRSGRTTAALMLAATVATVATADEGAPLDGRLVRVFATYQEQNAFMPWIYQSPGRRAGYGVLVSSNRVLTTEHLVRNQTHVELRLPRTGEKIPARIVIADYRINLALLEIPPGHEPSVLAPLATAPALSRQDSLTVVQIDDVEDIQSASASVTQISVAPLPDAPASLLRYSLLAQLNISGEGAPVLRGDRLAGLVMTYQPSTRIATMIGAPFIARFLEDAAGDAYRGTASAGFMWRPLIDPAKRAYLALPPDSGGILLVNTIPGTGAAAALTALDVILEWDGHSLDGLGFYEDDVFGRIEFSHLVKGLARPGDRVPVTVWREGRRRTVELALGGDPDGTALVPENVIGDSVEYLVTGGLVIRELDVAFLRAHGSEWRSACNPQLLNLYLNRTPSEQRPGDRVLILSGVLPDPINVGYQHMRSGIVTAVNRRPVRNMEEVFAIADTELACRLTLDGLGVDLVLDADQLADANARIADQYRIPALEFRRGPRAGPRRIEGEEPNP